MSSPSSTESANASTPIVLIGQTPRFGKFVARKLQPEYEVIHFVNDIDQAKGDMESIMAGESPKHDPDGVSTGNFSRLPKHIVFGKGFQWDKLQEIRALSGSENSGLCWYWAPIKPGDVLVKPAEVPFTSDEVIDKMTDKIVGTMRRVFSEVISQGKEGQDGIYEL